MTSCVHTDEHTHTHTHTHTHMKTGHLALIKSYFCRLDFMK